ncbi:histone-lysine N-methyltransferase PRDM9-like isoform X2 [Condylostylus longicornis]|nr:histone-lysine N-methyltransferase PRDM9-like isoform X2 [Condylostylus longicornis]
MNFETEDYEHYEKCGEIYFSESGRFELYCNLCDERFIDYSVFFGKNHLEQHFNYFGNCTENEVELADKKIENQNITENDKNKFEIEFREYNPQDHEVNIFIKDISAEDTEDASVKINAGNIKQVPFKINKLRCYVCLETFVKTSYRDRHVLKNHRDQYKGKYYSCKYCGQDFLHKSHFEQHIRKHTGERPFACTSCNKSFISIYNLNVHNSRYHQDIRPYICRVDDCNAGFKSWISRLKHERSHNRAEKLPFKCKECENKFANAGEMTRHVKSIHMDKGNLPYVCNICNRSFHQRRLLRYHIFTHTGEKPYACKVCNAKFSKPSILSQHKLLHSGTKKYICTVCGERFFQSAGLSAHKRKKGHFDEEP